MQYRDLDDSFIFNDLTKDVAVKIDHKAVEQQIKNILLTRRGSIPFEEWIGSDLDGLLFENSSLQVVDLGEEVIRQTIRERVSRVGYLEIVPDIEENGRVMGYTIIFSVKPEKKRYTFNIKMERTL